MNNSGFFAAVEVGCSLLKLVFSLRVFSRKTYGHSECMKYLLTDYIPEEWISEDLSYFQTDISADEEETIESSEMKISHPMTWLVRKSSEYGKYFSDASLGIAPKLCQSNPGSLSPFMKRMIIYRLGGGNITSIFSLLTDQKERDQVKVLENIISLYPSNPLMARLDQMDLVNYIAAHIALSLPYNPISKIGCSERPSETQSAVPNRETEKIMTLTLKRRPNTTLFYHLLIMDKIGWDKIVHKSKVETITKVLSISEKRMKWFSGEVWKMPEMAKLLRTVSGWTEVGIVYLDGPKEKKFTIPHLKAASVPYGNENVTFYLGFTFRGPVAYNITVKK
ncbi:unnamed protein product [Coregonus sp. 'balchen']|nr:unnamed protein product [Coregonus sp. 'balchen']